MIDAHQSSASTAPQFYGIPRLTLVDMARGLAILAMVVYHFSWDLSYFHIISADVNGDLGWRVFARSIASSFLFLVGIGLVLAHGRHFGAIGFIKRLAIIILAASAISVVTWWQFPDSFVFFGILHNIAVSSVIALPFVWLPVGVTLAAGFFTILLPFVFSASIFNAPGLIWLGLYTVQPVSNDYVPVFPWTGAVLLGVAVGRLIVANDRYLAILVRPIHGIIGRVLDFAGRRSLIIYLVHQPLLFGGLSLLVLLVGPFTPGSPTAGFVRECESGCSASGYGEDMCVTYCACITDGVVAQNLWTPIAENSVQPQEAAELGELAAQCAVETLN